MTNENFEDITSFQSLLSEIEQTEINIRKLRYYLIKQLNSCGINPSENLTFKELIEKVGDIDAPETYNTNNALPLNEPHVHESTNILDYLSDLYSRIRYYMRLLAYYLVLKSVPTSDVAQATTLKQLIDLIKLIKVRVPSTMVIQPSTEEYYFGLNIALNYTLTDSLNNPITEGEITIESEGILYDSITAGEPLSFTPIHGSTYSNGAYQPIPFTFTYHGTDKYSTHEPITIDFIILPSKIALDIFVSNINMQSEYYGRTDIGYTEDEWSIAVKTYNYRGDILPNIPFTINGTMHDVTDETGTCIINYSIDTVGTKTINVETTYENTQLLTNTSKQHTVQIYYNPLYQSTSNYDDYKGRPQYQYELIIRNKITGVLYDNTYNGQEINLYLNDNLLSPITIEEGKAIATVYDLDVGKHILKWVFQKNQKKTNITVHSNFILPNKNKFFLLNTPDIYYAPLYSAKYGTNNWSPVRNKQVIALLDFIDNESNVARLINNEILYTNSDAILHAIKEHNAIGEYQLTLNTNSDDLNETISYEYEIAKPFDIILNEETSDKKIQMEYNIHVFDTENYSYGDYIDCISFSNDIMSFCTVTETLVDEYYDINIIIPARAETYGTTTLTMEYNTYSESVTFKLMEKIFKLLTNTVPMGVNNIQLQCYDNSISEVNITSDFFSINQITKENNIFTINAEFMQIGEIPFSIYTEDGIEMFTITVTKGNITGSILIEKNAYEEAYTFVNTDTNEVISRVPKYEVSSCRFHELSDIEVSLLFDDSFYGDIATTYSITRNNTTLYTEYYTFNDNNNKGFIIPESIPPGEYNINFTHNSGSNSNYNSFVITTQFTILKGTPTLKINTQFSGYSNN